MTSEPKYNLNNAMPQPSPYAYTTTLSLKVEAVSLILLAVLLPLLGVSIVLGIRYRIALRKLKPGTPHATGFWTIYRESGKGTRLIWSITSALVIITLICGLLGALLETQERANGYRRANGLLYMYIQDLFQSN